MEEYPRLRILYVDPTMNAEFDMRRMEILYISAMRRGGQRCQAYNETGCGHVASSRL